MGICRNKSRNTFVTSSIENVFDVALDAHKRELKLLRPLLAAGKKSRDSS